MTKRNHSYFHLSLTPDTISVGSVSVGSVSVDSISVDSISVAVCPQPPCLSGLVGYRGPGVPERVPLLPLPVVLLELIAGWIPYLEQATG